MQQFDRYTGDLRDVTDKCYAQKPQKLARSKLSFASYLDLEQILKVIKTSQISVSRQFQMTYML